jgi:hypothetical protein
MPDITCPHCRHQFLTPGTVEVRKTRCPKCNAVVTVPAVAAAVEPHGEAGDWAAAPPPVRRHTPPPVRRGPAPAAPVSPQPPAAPSAPDPDPQLADAYADPRPPAGCPDDADEPEPWYYRFIERYVIICMWICLALCILSLAGWTLLLLIAETKGASVLGAGGGLFLFFQWLFLALMHFFLAMAIIYVCSWLLLALDAARNLRRIRIKLPHRP